MKRVPLHYAFHTPKSRNSWPVSYYRIYQLRCHSSLSEHRNAHLRVVEAIQSQTLGHNRLSNFFIVDTLRSCYPEHILTETSTSTGLLDLAKSGSLTANLDTAIPHYLSRVRNSEVDDITSIEYLKDDVQFARYNCHWQGCDFYMYEAEFAETEYTTISNHYILYPRQHAEASNGRSLAADKLIVAAMLHGNEVDREVWLYDDDCWQRSEKLWQNVEGSTWDDVILSEGLCREIRDDVANFFDRKDLYESFGVPWKRGIILHGLPGNGKTISIKVIMRSLSLKPTPIPTLYVKSLGHECTHSNIRSIFEKAREVAPCLLVFEDLDSLVTDNVRSFFLNEVDGLEQNDGILMLGSTNYLDKLDVGISKRPSRFDRKFHFPLPATAERVKYCERWRLKLRKNSLIEFPSELSERIAMVSEGLSFAYLQEVFVASMFAVMERTSIQRSTEASDKSDPLGLDSNIVWRTVSAQIAKVRKELEDGKKSVEDAGRNSVLKDAVSGNVRPTGFAR